MKHKLTAGLFFSAVFVKYCIASFTRVKNQNIPPFFFSQFGGSTEQQKKEKKRQHSVNISVIVFFINFVQYSVLSLSHI